LKDTLTFHTLSSIIDAFFHYFKKISLENPEDENLLNLLLPIFDHSKASLCQIKEANAHLVLYPRKKNFISNYFKY